MSIAIRRFIGKTRSRWCPSGQVAADSHSIASLNLPRTALTNGRPHSQLMLGSD
jgi:hypothetical protein